MSEQTTGTTPTSTASEEVRQVILDALREWAPLPSRIALADTIVTELTARQLVDTGEREWGVRLADGDRPRPFREQAAALRFLVPAIGDELVYRRPAGPWMTAQIPAPQPTVEEPSMIPLGWCPKCPNGMGMLTATGWRCDMCGATGADPAGR